MGLGLNTGGGGDFIPHIRYDARAGRMFRADRTQDAGGQWATDLVDISNPAPAFIMDLASIEVGWLHFGPTGPDYRMVRMGQPMPPQPGKDHKQAFRVRVNAPKLLGGTREFASSAKTVISAMDALHSAWEQAPERAQGLVPVVTLAGTTAVTTKSQAGASTNYAPRFEIIKWVPRPDDFPDAGAPAAPAPQPPPRPAPAAAAAPPPAGHVPPPPPRPAAPARAPAMAETEF
jgi:hypothetical protein